MTSEPEASIPEEARRLVIIAQHIAHLCETEHTAKLCSTLIRCDMNAIRYILARLERDVLNGSGP